MLLHSSGSALGGSEHRRLVWGTLRRKSVKAAEAAGQSAGETTELLCLSFPSLSMLRTS